MEEQKKFPEPVEALIVILLSFGMIIIMALVVSVITSFSFINVSIEESNRYFYILGGLLFLIVPTMYIRLKKYDIVYLPTANAKALITRGVARVIETSAIIGERVVISGEKL